MKYLVDDNQLPITFRTVFEELISEQTRLSVAVRVREGARTPLPKSSSRRGTQTGLEKAADRKWSLNSEFSRTN